jgi:propanol-preferring alcohol dehydrogenase
MTQPSLPTKMWAAQIVSFNTPYKVHQIPLPSPLAPQDLLIKVAVASLCHTDSLVSSGNMGTPLPCTASHEGAGTVVAIGSSVTNFGVGDRVMAGILYHSCGTCAECTGPAACPQYCQNTGGFLGITTHGFFAQYAKVDAKQTAKLPHNVSFETAAPLACAGVTVYRGVVLSEAKKGDWIAIVGSGGGLGHLGVRFAKAKGLNVVGIDARDEGLELTRQCGADVTIDARMGHEEVVKAVRACTGNEGVKATLNVSDADSSAALACAVTKMHGTLIQLAQPQPHGVVIPFQELILRDIRVRGSAVATLNDAQDMLELVALHGITVQTNSFRGLGEIEKLVELAHGGKMKGKGIVIMDHEQIERGKKIGAAL